MIGLRITLRFDKEKTQRPWRFKRIGHMGFGVWRILVNLEWWSINETP